MHSVRMGVPVEFNSVLALRNHSAASGDERSAMERIPASLVAGSVHEFLKSGQRIYRLDVEIPLVETRGGHDISRPLASIMIIEATHVLRDGAYWTKGTYRIAEVFDPADPAVHFEFAHRARRA